MYRVIQTFKSALVTSLFALLLVAPFGVVSGPRATAATPGCTGPTNCKDTGLPKAPAANCAKLTSCDVINKYIDPLIKTLTALVGVAVVISIIIGGIQYSSSEGDPGKASAAKNRIRNAVIALITFILLSAMLNFLIPGGLL